VSEREPLSVVVITKNEERNLDRCLRSVSWADEIVVVDSESTDRTREVAERHGARVFVRPWPGYVEQWNFALSRTTHLWHFVLAADEWISDASALEIQKVLEAPLADGYRMDRLSAFRGAFVRWAWHPDSQLRLFRKDRGRFEGGRVHESVQMAPGCRVERLREKLLHLTYRSVDEYIDRINRYTGLAAATLDDRGKRFTVLALVVKPPATFFKYYVLKLGVLDGMRGFLVSVGASLYVFLRHAKLWELHAAPDPNFLSAAGTTPEDPDPAAPRAGGGPRSRGVEKVGSA
jgi:glycosyltransferase involved in cell wall biosynthesis